MENGNGNGNGNGMARDVGRLEGRMEAFERQMTTLLSDVSVIKSAFDQAKGGWKAVAVIGGCAGMLTAIGAEIAIRVLTHGNGS